MVREEGFEPSHSYETGSLTFPINRKGLKSRAFVQLGHSRIMFLKLEMNERELIRSFVNILA